MKTKNIQHSSKTKKFPIFGILKKTVSHRQKPENTIHNEARRQSYEIDTELTQMFELADKDIKMVIVTVFHMFKSYVEA